ncbi:hypothetical protein HanPI659440_Chr12g0448701 [Helianthus annuus]|nr:hypothetical protein HanPI659440_Chr12g0448701 [Helianthus annuus]
MLRWLCFRFCKVFYGMLIIATHVFFVAAGYVCGLDYSLCNIQKKKKNNEIKKNIQKKKKN